MLTCSVKLTINSAERETFMNGDYGFARRILTVAALAMLVVTGWPQFGQAQTKGVDPQAEKLVRRMSEYLASRQPFTLKAESILEPVMISGQKLQYDSPATDAAAVNAAAAQAAGNAAAAQAAAANAVAAAANAQRAAAALPVGTTVP
jgi:hypothetical protein